ncbi:MAG TPA: iron ABC transporter permease, partial [Gammaproteobacteria bacterium]|nr:iron ABC transporter permease [Gammaproteobacteria bacterium]
MKIACLLMLLFLSILVSLLTGSVPITMNELREVLSLEGDYRLMTIVLDIRLPRSLLALMVGAGVAVAGASIQGLFRNPLADP